MARQYCDEAPSTSAALTAKLSAYDSDVLSEVPIQDTYQDNFMLDHSVHKMYYSEQPAFINNSDTKITSDSNIISYDQYLKDNESEVVQGTTSHEQQDVMIMVVIEEMSNEVAKCNAVNQENKTVNESLTAELERYKEHVKIFEERHKFDLKDSKKYIDSQMRGIIVDRNAKDIMRIAMHVDVENKFVLPANDETLKYSKMEQTYIDDYSRPCKNQDAPEFSAFFEINELKTQLQKKNTTIINIKDHNATLKDLQPLSPKLRQNREVHVDYLKQTKKYAHILRDIVKQARALQPIDSALDYACKFTTRIQELLVYISATCPISLNKSEKLVVVKPMNKSRKVKFIEPRVKSSTSASGSKPSVNTNKNRISRTSSSNQKNKVENHLRSVKSSSHKKNSVSECNASTNHVVLDVNSKFVCSIGLLRAIRRHNGNIWPPSVVSRAPATEAPIPNDTIDTPSSTSIDQDVRSASISPTNKDTQAPVLHQDVEGQETPNAGIFINQSKYALEILKKYGMESSDPVDTLMVERTKLDEDLQGIPVDPTRYHGVKILEEVPLAVHMLGNLKFTKKAVKDLIYGMAIPLETMSDEIKAFADYLDYLAKTKGETPVKGRGNGLLTKKGVTVAVEKLETVHVLKKKRTETVIEETSQSEEVVEIIDSEETEDEEEITLIRRQTGVVIGRQAYKDSDEEDLDHSKKLKGIKTLSDAAQFMVNIKKARKTSKDGFILQQHFKGSDISSDDERSEADDMEKIEKVRLIKLMMTKLKKRRSSEIKIQSMVEVSICQKVPVIRRPQLVYTFISMIPEKTTQPSQSRRKTKVILKRSKKPETQADTDVILKRFTTLETKIEAMSKVNLPKAIGKSVQAHLKKVLSKDAPDFSKIKQEKAVKQSMPKFSIKLFDEVSLKEYDRKDKLLKLIMKSKSYNIHPIHNKLYEALMDSHLDPPADVDKESKKRKRKDYDASSSNKSKDKKASSKKDDEELAHDDVMDVKGVTHDDTTPKQDRCPYDLSKPLSLQGPSGRTTILVDFFFNKDLEYLETGNKEKKYASSLTKPKAARYELEGLEEMILKLWSSSKEGA
nr:hypothetical protein [Tanacetum cinerariifolium]